MPKKIVSVYDENKQEKAYYLMLNEFYNKTSIQDVSKRDELLSKMLKKVGKFCIIETPFRTTWGGKNVTLGDHIYINCDCMLVDDGDIIIGNHTLIGPRTTIITNNHAIEAKKRQEGIIEIEEVIIGKNVWIGAGTIILPGVHIGDRTVIGAGSVVTSDIPSDVVAVGNPCRVIKQIDNTR